MWSANAPVCAVTIFTPGPGDPKNTIHPIVQLPACKNQLFSLLPLPGSDPILCGVNHTNQAGKARRIHTFAMVCDSDPGSPSCTTSQTPPPGVSRTISMRKVDLSSGANLWFGASPDNSEFSKRRSRKHNSLLSRSS